MSKSRQRQTAAAVAVVRAGLPVISIPHGSRPPLKSSHLGYVVHQHVLHAVAQRDAGRRAAHARTRQPDLRHECGARERGEREVGEERVSRANRTCAMNGSRQQGAGYMGCVGVYGGSGDVYVYVARTCTMPLTGSKPT